MTRGPPEPVDPEVTEEVSEGLLKRVNALNVQAHLQVELAAARATIDQAVVLLIQAAERLAGQMDESDLLPQIGAFVARVQRP